MRWAGHVAGMGDRRGAHRVLVGRPDGKKQLGRPKRRWKDNIEVDGMGWEKWTGLIWLGTGTGAGFL